MARRYTAAIYFFTGGGGAMFVLTLDVVDAAAVEDAAVFAFFATGSGTLNENDAVELK